MKRRHIKFLLWFVPLVALIILLGRYPIWADKWTRPKRASDWVLTYARPTEPRLSRNDKEFLFLVWFAGGNFGQGRKYCVAESGRSYGWRLL